MRAALADLPRDQAANVLRRPSSARLPLARALLGAIQREVERLRGITEEYLRLARLPQPRLPEGVAVAG